MPDGFHPLAPHLATALAFVEALTGSAETPMRLSLLFPKSAIPSGRTKADYPTRELVGRVADLWPEVLDYQARGYGVFYFLNEVAADCPRTYATNADVRWVRALAVDDDARVNGSWHLEPPIVVTTSPGKRHAIWPVQDCLPGGFRAAQDRLAEFYGTDHIGDLKRILRLPGSLHTKDPAKPSLVTFEVDLFSPSGAALTGEVLEGIPELPPVGTRASSAMGKPVSAETVRRILAYHDPDQSYPQWRRVLCALKETPIIGEAEGRDDLRFALAVEWSHQAAGYAADEEDDIRPIWDAIKRPKDGSTVTAGFGSLWAEARARGYQEPPDGIQPMGEAFGHLAPGGLANELPAAPRSTRTRIFDRHEWADAFKSPAWLIEGLLPDRTGDGAAIVAHTESYKSFILAGMMFAVCTGRPAFGGHAVTRQAPCYYFCAEGSGGFVHERWPALEIAHGLEVGAVENIHFIPAVPLLADGATPEDYLADIKEHLRTHYPPGTRPGIVAFDTASRMQAGMNSNEDEAADKLAGFLVQVERELGCTAVAVTHKAKGKGRDNEEDDSPAGNRKFEAAIGWSLVLQPDPRRERRKGSQRWVIVRAGKQRDGDGMEPAYLWGRKVAVPGLEGAGMVFDALPANDVRREEMGVRPKKRGKDPSILEAFSEIQKQAIRETAAKETAKLLDASVAEAREAAMDNAFGPFVKGKSALCWTDQRLESIKARMGATSRPSQRAVLAQLLQATTSEVHRLRYHERGGGLPTGFYPIGREGDFERLVRDKASLERWAAWIVEAADYDRDQELLRAAPSPTDTG